MAAQVTMPDLLFYLFSGLALGCGFLVVANPFSRNPVTSAMFLVLTIVSLAGLFVLLQAFFLAAVQILVYAGAVMVLFLFVIMLLNLEEEERRKVKRAGALAGGLLVLALMSLLVGSLWMSSPPSLPAPRLEGSTANLGQALFTDFLLPFEIMSVLLLVAILGVVTLSRKEPK